MKKPFGYNKSIKDTTFLIQIILYTISTELVQVKHRISDKFAYKFGWAISIFKLYNKRNNLNINFGTKKHPYLRFRRAVYSNRGFPLNQKKINN